jgi:hypothetical protein
MVLDLVGCTNILSKIMGSPNKLNNALATVEALSTFKIGKFPERAKKKAEVVTTSEDVVAVSETTPLQETAPKKAVVKKPTSSAEKKPAPKKATPKKDA